MQSKLLPLLITLAVSSVGCGTKAPFVDDCLIDTTLMRCSGKLASPKDGIQGYDLTPLKAHKYICRDTADFLVSRIYILKLEKNLAKCIKTPEPVPQISDCVVDGENSALYCSEGVSVKTLTWAEAYKYLCVSPADSVLLLEYRNDLLNDIANCTPSK